MAAVARASNKIPTPKPTPAEVREVAISFLLYLCVSRIERDVERRRVALTLRRQRERQLVSTALVDAVCGVPLVTLPLLGVRSLRVDLVGEGIVEVELRGEFVALLGFCAVADREVDVDGPALVPAGVDRREPRGAVLVRHLIPAQERRPRSAEIPGGVVLDARVLAQSVAMPDVHHSASQRAAGGDVALVDPGDVERQLQRDALSLLPDVGAVEPHVYVVRSLRLLGPHHAGSRSRLRTRPGRLGGRSNRRFPRSGPLASAAATREGYFFC